MDLQTSVLAFPYVMFTIERTRAENDVYLSTNRIVFQEVECEEAPGAEGDQLEVQLLENGCEAQRELISCQFAGVIFAPDVGFEQRFFAHTDCILERFNPVGFSECKSFIEGLYDVNGEQIYCEVSPCLAGSSARAVSFSMECERPFIGGCSAMDCDFVCTSGHAGHSSGDHGNGEIGDGYEDYENGNSGDYGDEYDRPDEGDEGYEGTGDGYEEYHNGNYGEYEDEYEGIPDEGITDTYDGVSTETSPADEYADGDYADETDTSVTTPDDTQESSGEGHNGGDHEHDTTTTTEPADGEDRDEREEKDDENRHDSDLSSEELEQEQEEQQQMVTPGRQNHLNHPRHSHPRHSSGVPED